MILIYNRHFYSFYFIFHNFAAFRIFKNINSEHILSNEIFNQNQYEIPRPEVLLQYGFPEVGGQPNIKKRKSNK